MVAGEFAVLEPNYKLVVMAVDRFVYATLQSSSHNTLTLENFALHDLSWDYIDNEVQIDSEDNRVNFVQDAMTIALTYLKECSIVPTKFTLSIKSELDDPSGTKYGLGSSAAVVVSVISAITKKFLPEEPSNDLLFKLAAISHIKTQGNGSGADIAASVYGGLLEYSSFQADWLQSEYESTETLTELLAKDWIYFSVERLQLPEHTYICVGWTGTPASTKSLVSEILKLKKVDQAKYTQFLLNSETAVNIFLRGIKEENKSLLFEGIKQNRQSLSVLGKHAHVEVETTLLKELSILATEVKGAGKLSGAGGGDCGIAFVSTEAKRQQLYSLWNNAGIKPLAIDIYSNGVQTI